MIGNGVGKQNAFEQDLGDMAPGLAEDHAAATMR